MHFTYILQSQTNGRFYIGHTADLASRLHRHNSGAVAATRNKGPWKLVHFEEFVELLLDKLKLVLLDFLSSGYVSLEGYTLREDVRRFELYEKNRALTLGLVKPVEYATKIGMERIWERIVFLSDILRNV